MNILFITRKYPPKKGGMETFSYEFSKELSKYVTLYKIVWKKSQKWLFYFIPYSIIKSMFLIRKNNIDLVHIGDPALSIVGYILKKSFKIPTICNIHGLDITFNNSIYQWCLKKFLKFNTCICISNYVKELAEGKNLKNLRVIPIAINSQKYKTNQEKKALKNKISSLFEINLKNRKILLTVGRLVKRKGVFWFINNVFKKFRNNIVYLIVGKGKEDEKIRELIKKNNLETSIFLLGEVDNKLLKLLYNIADIFVMPNIKVQGDVEGFGIVALEASSCGIPVIASNIEGIRDAIVDGKNGFLVESENSNQFIFILNKLLQDDKYRISFGNKAKEYVSLNFNWEKNIDNYIKIYKDTIYRYKLKK